MIVDSIVEEELLLVVLEYIVQNSQWPTMSFLERDGIVQVWILPT